MASALLVGLHLIFLRHAGGLWRDEANSVAFATMPSLARIWSSLGLDSFPILPTLALRLWTMGPWGADEGALRVLGLAVGLALLAALWLAARALGARTPWLALALFGFNAVAIRTTDALRPYGLGTLAIVLAFASIWRLMERPGPARFLWAALAAVGAVQCLYPNACLLLGIVLAGVAVGIRRQRGSTALAVGAVGAIAALSIVPYARALRVAGEWAPLNQFDLGVSAIGRELWQALQAGSPLVAFIWLGLPVIAIVRAAGAVSRETVRRPAAPAPGADTGLRRSDALIFSAIVLVVSSAAFLVFLRLTRVPTRPWYYVPLMALVAAALNGALGGWAASGDRPARKPGPSNTVSRALIPVGALTFAIALAWSTLVGDLRVRQTSIDLVARRIAAEAGPEDLVLVAPWDLGVSFQHYYRGRARWTTLPSLADHTIHRYDLLRWSMQTVGPTHDVLAGVEQTLRGGHRLWLVGSLSLPPEGEPVPILPPAPKSGPWPSRSGQYLDSWAMQVGELIRSHATGGGLVDIPIPDPVSPFEQPALTVVSGWKD